MFNTENVLVYADENTVRLLLEHIFFSVFMYLPEQETVFVCSYSENDNASVMFEFVFSSGCITADSLSLAECIAQKIGIEYLFIPEENGRSMIQLKFPTA